MPTKYTPPLRDFVCQQCGAPFQSRQRDAKYCSPPCVRAGVGAAKRGRTLPERWVTRTCPTCGQDFTVLRSNRKVYCSQPCAAAAPERQALMREFQAAQMADPAQREHWLAGIARRSASPAWRAAPHFQPGPAHPRYRGNIRARREQSSQYVYKAWRKAVLTRDNFTCQRCGERGGRLTAHHLQSWAEHPDLRFAVENGQTLCQPCHDAVHGRVHRPKTFHCVVCGKAKTDGRRPRCRSCGARTRGQLSAPQ